MNREFSIEITEPVYEGKQVKIAMRPGVSHDMEVTQAVFFGNCQKIKPEYFTGGMIIDIGAYIGSFSQLASIMSGNKAVIAYEPEPGNFKVLKKNAKTGGYNITCVNKAVGTPGKVKIINHHAASYVDTVDSVCEGSIVDRVSINDIITSECDILKLDCEGDEYNIVFDASDETLKRIKRLHIEFHLHENEEHMEMHHRCMEKLMQYFEVESYPELPNGVYTLIRK